MLTMLSNVISYEADQARDASSSAGADASCRMTLELGRAVLKKRHSQRERKFYIRKKISTVMSNVAIYRGCGLITTKPESQAMTMKKISNDIIADRGRIRGCPLQGRCGA